jgi:hypothetical protein
VEIPESRPNEGYFMYRGKGLERIFRYMTVHGDPLPSNNLTLIGMTCEVEPDPGNPSYTGIDLSALPGERLIVSYTLLQLVPLVEPMKAAKGWGHTLRGLFRAMREFIYASDCPRVLMHTDNRAMQFVLGAEEGVDKWPEGDQFYNWSKPEATPDAPPPQEAADVSVPIR